MSVEMLIQQVASHNGWALAQGTHGGYRIEVPTEYGRSQVVEIMGKNDPDGRPMAWIWSLVTEVANVGDPWYLLGLNAELAYGALAVRDGKVVVSETQLLGTADYEELQRAIFYVARYADDLEKQVHGHHDQH